VLPKQMPKDRLLDSCTPSFSQLWRLCYTINYQTHGGLV
jgi:hypothetical protein